MPITYAITPSSFVNSLIRTKGTFGTRYIWFYIKYMYSVLYISTFSSFTANSFNNIVTIADILPYSSTRSSFVFAFAPKTCIVNSNKIKISSISIIIIITFIIMDINYDYRLFGIITKKNDNI